MFEWVCGEKVAVRILKVIFLVKKWRKSKMWGKIFVNLQALNNN